MTRYTDEDLREDHRMVGEMFGDDPGCGGTWSWSGPPCGGCVDCAHAMASHSHYEGRARARRFQSAGLDWAPEVEAEIANALPLGSMADRHDSWGHLCAGERQ